MPQKASDYRWVQMILYLATVVLFSWPWQIISALYAAGYWQILVFNGLSMISVAAVTAVFLQKEKAWGKTGLDKGRPRQYLLAFAIAFVTFGPTLIFHQYSFWQDHRPSEFVPPSLVALALLFVYFVCGFGEELGWRGYVLPRFLDSYPPRRSVVMLGVIWGMWHWPLLITKVALQEGSWDLSFFGFTALLLTGNLVLTIPLCAIFCWLWARTRSIFVVAFLHGAFDWVRDMAVLYPSTTPLPMTLKFLPQTVMLALGSYLLWKGNFVPASQK